MTCSTLRAKYAALGAKNTPEHLIVNTCFTDPLCTSVTLSRACYAYLNVTDLAWLYSLNAFLSTSLDLLSAKPTLLRWRQLRFTLWAVVKVWFLNLTKEFMGVRRDGLV